MIRYCTVRWSRGYVLEMAVGKYEKLEKFKSGNLKLEIFHLSWKVPIEVGKFQ